MDDKEELELYWKALSLYSVYGQLNLEAIPRECWHATLGGQTMLHCACQGNNPKAIRLLLAAGIDANSQTTEWKGRPIHYAVHHGVSSAIELLCAAGADIVTGSKFDPPPLQIALRYGLHSHGDAAKLLIANGVRLNNCDAPRELVEFERGVLCCRTAVVALLRVKKAGELRLWDKFLLREVAYAVWATRAHKEWQN